VLAELDLLRCALGGGGVKKGSSSSNGGGGSSPVVHRFIFVSESCIPIAPLDHCSDIM